MVFKISNGKWLHYVFNYGVLLVSWVPMMNFFQNNVWFTAAAGFVLFVASDLFSEKVFKVR